MFIKDFLTKKTNIDFSWNLAGYALIAISGFILNVLIYNFYGSEYLGVFNQIYAIYILLSQLTVGGYHLSVQRYISKFNFDLRYSGEILISSIIITSVQSIIIIYLFYYFKEIPGKLLKSEILTQSFVFALPGLFFFAVNKLLISYLNSIRDFKLFSIFISLRVVLLVVYLLILKVLDISYIYIPLIFLFSELSLFFLFILKIKIEVSRLRFKIIFSWLRKHFDHGYKSIIGHFLLDVNTKVDILILGYFTNDVSVGNYSIASSVVEGLSQIPYIFRNIYNPIISKLYYFKPKQLFLRVMKKTIKFNYKFYGIVFIISTLGFPLVLKIFLPNFDFTETYICFIILNLGLLISSGYIPLQMIFNQTGFPKIQTLFTSIVCFTNIFLNILLVQRFEIIGAAIATATAFFTQVVVLKFFSHKIIKFRI